MSKALKVMEAQARRESRSRKKERKQTRAPDRMRLLERIKEERPNDYMQAEMGSFAVTYNIARRAGWITSDEYAAASRAYGKLFNYAGD